MGVRGKPSLTRKDERKAVRPGRKKGRRAAMEATRVRLGLDRKREESAEKKAMYGAWMGRAGEAVPEEEDAESGEEQGVCPLYAAAWAAVALCALCAASVFARRTRKR